MSPGDLASALPMLRIRGVTKSFPGVVANDSVDLDIRRGEVHTLLGENGAGKSTLAAMLAGLYRPDSGTMVLDGKPVNFANPREAQSRGIGMVHQHFRLVERFTVAENIALGDTSQPWKLDTRALESDVQRIGEEFGLPVRPDARISDLSVGERQRVEIVKTLYRGAEVLLLDEPTAVLTPQEVDALFVTVRAMRESGKAVVFISHKLVEVMAISDVVTVLRAGKVTGTVQTRDTNQAELARLMVGREVELSSLRAMGVRGSALLSVSCVGLVASKRHVLRDISFDVHGGEIVGIAGVSGNGQRELAETIAGIRAPSTGSISVASQSVGGKGPRKTRAAGLSFVPEDRLGTGLAPSMSIAENLLLTRPRSLFISKRKVQAEAAQIIADYDVKAPGPDAVTSLLSGGNSQKVLLARELAASGDGATSNHVLVVASPTRGLDIGATESIRKRLDDLRQRGGAVLLISEDLEEVLALSDRVLVIYDGAMVYECDGASADRTTIGLAMAGAIATENSGHV